MNLQCGRVRWGYKVNTQRPGLESYINGVSCWGKMAIIPFMKREIVWLESPRLI